ncbi:MAG TPA: hypothetical protein VF596_17470 [Pyrinomonadaceae bacterium]|jgi:hypothetical protein
MKLKDGMFQVVKDENVTITIKSSFDSGNQVVAVLDEDENNDPFNFKVTKNVGQQHEVRIRVEFIGASTGAHYTIKINGEGAGNEGPFTRFIKINSASNKRVYNFRVV